MAVPRIVLRNDTAANWEAVKDTATLYPGEFGVENDTGLFKIGKEKAPSVFCTWAELGYANSAQDPIKIIYEGGNSYSARVEIEGSTIYAIVLPSAKAGNILSIIQDDNEEDGNESGLYVPNIQIVESVTDSNNDMAQTVSVIKLLNPGENNTLVPTVIEVVTKAGFETVLGAYITDIDKLIGDDA